MNMSTVAIVSVSLWYWPGGGLNHTHIFLISFSNVQFVHMPRGKMLEIALLNQTTIIVKVRSISVKNI